MVGAAAAMALVGALWMVLFKDRLALSKHASLGEVFALAKHGGLRRVAAMHFCLFGGYLALLGMLARALIERGMAPAQAGLSVAGWLVAAGAANFLGPILSDRLGSRRVVLVGGGLVAGSALLLLAVIPNAPVLPLLVIAALGGGCVAPLLLTLPLELEGVGPPRAGAALGLLMLVGQAGGFLLPELTVQAMQRGGFVAAVAFLGIVHLLIALPAMGIGGARRVDGTGVPAAT
jgi:nitrate/nitrite transporter NarK